MSRLRHRYGRARSKIVQRGPRYYECGRATAFKHLKWDGDSFTGWVVSWPGGYSDPIATKREALKLLAEQGAEHPRE